MADIYEFKCGHCGYEAEVPGDRSWSDKFEWQTILCRNCGELHCVAVTERHEWDEGDFRREQEQSDNPAFSRLLERLLEESLDAEATKISLEERVDQILWEDPDAPPPKQLISLAWPLMEGWCKRKLDLRCPRSESHRWELWQHPGPCPRCGETMERGRRTMSVD